MRQRSLVIKPCERLDPRAVILSMHPIVGILLWGLCLGFLVVSFYLAPTITALGIAALGLGLPLFLLMWFRPEFGLLVVIFLTSSFVPANVIDLRLPIGGGLDLRDLVLLGMLGLLVLRELAIGSIEVPWWPVGGPLLLFMIIAIFSAFYALTIQNVESNWALSDLRILIYYAAFFLTIWSMKQPQQLKVLLLGMFIIADLTVAVIFLQQSFGANNPLLTAMTMSRDWRVDQEAGAVRIVPAGHVLMHFMWLVALGVLMFTPRNHRLRAFCAVQLLYIGVGHILTFTRAQWMAMFLGIGLIVIINLPKYKNDLIKVAIIGTSVSLVLVMLWGIGWLSVVSDTPLVTGVVDRFSSLLAPAETMETGSLQWRSFENEKVLQALRQHPVTGMGLGARYRDLTTFQGEAKGYLTRGSIAAGEISRFTRYVHNSYLSISVKMGTPALIILLWFCSAFLFKGWQMYQDLPESVLKGLVLGVLTGFLGLLLWSFFHPHLIKAESTVVISVMTGIVGSIGCIYHCGSASRPILGC